MSRHDQLEQALKRARNEHQNNPSRSTFLAMRSAANTLNQWREHQDRLKEMRRKAAILFRDDEVKRIDKALAKHALPEDPVGEVKLLETAGTIRLDLNGRRTFMNREQAMSLFAKLGAALYKYDYSDISCDFRPADHLKISHDRHGRCADVLMVRGDDDCSMMDVSLSADKTLKAAIAMAAVAVEVRKDEL